MSTLYTLENIQTGHTYTINFKTLFEIIGNNKFCIAYSRQSTISQQSLSEQFDEIKQNAISKNYIFIIKFSSIGSGWNVSNLKKLIGFNVMIDFIPKVRKRLTNNYNFDNIYIYIYDVSRLMRNILVATKYINDIFDPNNCVIYSVLDNKEYSKNSQNRITFLRELIESESFSFVLSNKIKRNIINRKRRGEHVGGTKYGYETHKSNNRLILRKNKKEQKILGYIKRNKNMGTRYDKICRLLNVNNMFKRGKMWNKNMIKYVINTSLNNVEEYDLNLSEVDNWIYCDGCRNWAKVSENDFNNFKNKPKFYCKDINLDCKDINHNLIDINQHLNSFNKLSI